MCKENNIDITEIEPTEEIMRLWSIDSRYTRDDIEYVKCSDGVIRPIDFHNWSKDIKHDFCVRPHFPQDDCIRNEWFNYVELVRCGVITKLIETYGDDMRDDVIAYLKRLKEVKGMRAVMDITGVTSSATAASYLNKQRKLSDSSLNEVLHDLAETIEFYSPEYIVKECDAGYELMFIQRWFYRLAMEVKYV